MVHFWKGDLLLAFLPLCILSAFWCKVRQLKSDLIVSYSLFILLKFLFAFYPEAHLYFCKNSVADLQHLVVDPEILFLRS